MILALLFATASPASAVEAERAFAAMAQTQGQWTAFRAYAAPEALLFVPKPVRAHDWLKGRKDPAVGYMWWPAAAYVSCDGKTAATTGPSVIGASRGYFTTIWQLQADGTWKWVLDHGDALAKPRAAAEKTVERKAACKPAPTPRVPTVVKTSGGAGGKEETFGNSADKSLGWSWSIDDAGNRTVEVFLWNGRTYETVITERVSGPRR